MGAVVVYQESETPASEICAQFYNSICAQPTPPSTPAQRAALRRGLFARLVFDRFLLARVKAHGLGLDTGPLGALGLDGRKERRIHFRPVK